MEGVQSGVLLACGKMFIVLGRLFMRGTRGVGTWDPDLLLPHGKAPSCRLWWSRFQLNPQPDPSTLYSYNPNFGIFVI